MEKRKTCKISTFIKRLSKLKDKIGDIDLIEALERSKS